jgi:hypothetical protein
MTPNGDTPPSPFGHHLPLRWRIVFVIGTQLYFICDSPAFQGRNIYTIIFVSGFHINARAGLIAFA